LHTNTLALHLFYHDSQWQASRAGTTPRNNMAQKRNAFRQAAFAGSG